MAEMKDKAKGLMKKLNPFSSSTRFKGEGHKLGSTEQASGNPPNAAPRQVVDQRPKQQQQQQQQHDEWRKLQQERWEAEQLKADKSSGKSRGSSKGNTSLQPSRTKLASSEVPQKTEQRISPQESTLPYSSPAPVESPRSDLFARNCTLNDSQAELVSTDKDRDRDADKEEVEVGVVTFLSAGASDAAVEVVARLLRNIVREPKSEKFRKIRMGNPKIQETIGSAAGGAEFLQFLGFQSVIEENEAWYVMDEPTGHRLELLKDATTMLETHSRNVPRADGSAGDSTARDTTAKEATERTSDPPDRQVRIFYASPDTAVVRAEIPESFYELSLDEVKKHTAMKRKKLEESQLLIPKSFREKQAAAARQKYKFSVVRIQFPDNVVLQGVFLPKEPTSAIYSFVQSALKNQVQFQLIDPAAANAKARTISCDPGSCTLDQADLLPSAVLKFHTSAAEFSGLRADYLSRIEPLTPSPF